LKLKKHILILTLFGLLAKVSATAQSGTNYMQFDRKKFHFGFALGTNSANFNYKFKIDSTNVDSVINVNIQKQPGFNLGIISSWNINQVIHIRFVPSLSFQERIFTYNYKLKGELKTRTSRLESTTLDFPIMLKLRTKRINNFAAYFLTGLQYSLDLASQSKTAINVNDPIMKMKQHDFAYQFGGGFDFFMEYFKLGLELKVSNGLRNVNIPDGTFFNAPLTDLRTKVWWFSVTFEG